MRAVVLLSLLMLASSAMAQDASGVTRSVQWTQALTATAPDAATVGCVGGSQVTRGLDLRNARGFRLLLTPAAGQTLSGAGTLRMWHFDFRLGLWVENPDLLRTVTVASGSPGQAWPDQSVLVRSGCLYVTTSGVTVSGGTSVTITAVAWTGGT